MSAARSPEALHRTLRAYRQLLEQAFPERLVSLRLFGSRARGDADPDSDADVAVVISGLTDEERARAIDLAFEAWRPVRGPLLAPLVWSEQEESELIRAERRIALDVASEGIPV